MKTLIVGDVHGCGLELRKLIENSNPSRVILVGDAFDRAPWGVHVWEMLQDSTLDISMVMGNHEAKFLDFFEGRKRYLPKHYYAFLNAYLEAGYKLDVFYNFLKTLPTVIKLSDNACVCHAGANFNTPLEPDYSINVYGGYLDDQRKLRDKKKDDWSRVYEESGSNVLVYYGHVAYNDVVSTRNSVCLDTSACHGGKLSGIIHETMTIHSVQSRDYFTKQKKVEIIPDTQIDQFKLTLQYG